MRGCLNRKHELKKQRGRVLLAKETKQNGALYQQFWC